MFYWPNSVDRWKIFHIVKTTEIYTHFMEKDILAVNGPLETLELPLILKYKDHCQ